LRNREGGIKKEKKKKKVYFFWKKVQEKLASRPVIFGKKMQTEEKEGNRFLLIKRKGRRESAI